MINFIEQGMSIKEASRQTGIAYENARAIYKIYKNENRKTLSVRGRGNTLISKNNNSAANKPTKLNRQE